MHNSDITIELANNKIEVHYSKTESFKVTLIDTGLKTNTAGRLKRIKEHVKDETFMLTYGDGLSNINIENLLSFHNKKGKLATLTSIQVPGRFGNLEISENGNVNFSLNAIELYSRLIVVIFVFYKEEINKCRNKS